MGISDLIAEFINSSLSESGGTVELQRGELAQRFGCVPSQINYVISTRFSPEHGFVVESRRGGGGYIRIHRVTLNRSALLMHAINAVGADIDNSSASAIITSLYHAGALSRNEARLIMAALSDYALHQIPVEVRPALRADILKQTLLSIAE